MDFSGFCKPFYKYGGKRAFILRGIDGQAKIAEFFLTKALLQSTAPALSYGDDSFRKWFTGERKVPAEIWAEIAKTLSTTSFAEEISAVLNEKFLMKVATDFEISFEKGEVPEKDALSSVIAQQFLEIARGDGEAYNVMNELYHSAFSYNDYSNYIQKSLDKYSKMKTLLYTSSEHDFYEFFVCNDIRAIDFRNVHDSALIKAIESGELAGSRIDWEKTLLLSGINGGTIKSVTMEKLKKLSQYTLLVGMGGIGKSMMMRHLFLLSNKEYKKSGLLPILVILREFNPESTNLIRMITDSVSRFDSTFSIQQLKILLANGKCRLLLDGLDEIKSSDTNSFLKQLDALIDQYPDNQIVMSTRRYSSFVELSRFRIMEMMPFTRKQSLELIGNLEYCPEEPKLKQQFIEKLKSEYFKTHAEFVNNPLLLTLMLMSYHRFAGIPEKRHLFYEQAYDTLLMRHDSGKLYNRVFHSVNDPSDFSKVFQEFCAKSYRRHDYEFDRAKIATYFDKLKSTEWLDCKKMTLENFIYDACHSACLMYEEGQTYHFLHRSFQEYLFAKYYSHKDGTTLQKLSRSLLEAEYDPREDEGAFMMMYDLDPENVEKFVLYPYLDKIFNSNSKGEREQFWSYISKGYSEWQFPLLYSDRMKKYGIDNDHILFLERSGGLSAKSVIQIKLTKMLSRDYDSPRDLSSLTIEDINKPESMLLIGRDFTERNAGEIGIRLFPVPSDENEMKTLRQLTSLSKIITENNEPVVFGYICCISFNEVINNPEKYSKIISIWEDERSPAKAEFYEMKKLYEKFRIKYSHTEDMDDDDF